MIRKYFRKPPLAEVTLSPLSPGDLETLDDIRSSWQPGGTPSVRDREIIDFAVRLMWRDMDRGAEQEVLEELKREVLYRQWCAGDESNPAGDRRQALQGKLLRHRSSL